MPRALSRDFYDRDPELVARELLGKLLICRTDAGVVSGRIVEAEAYLSANDPACHAHRGRTRKNASMFGPPGHAYVYPIHAKYCFNAVTQPPDVASAVLIRAVEPLEGLELMRQRRLVERPRDLTSGPSKLCQALGIDRQFDGADLTRSQSVWIADDPTFAVRDEQIGLSPRIGVSSAESLELRFFLIDNEFVSGPKRWHRRLRETDATISSSALSASPVVCG